MERGARQDGDVGVFRRAGGCVGKRRGVRGIREAGSDPGLRYGRWRLSAGKNRPSDVNSSVPGEAFQRCSSVFYRFRGRTGVKGLREREQ